MKAFVVPSSSDMQRLNRQQRLMLTQRLQDALTELAVNKVASKLAIDAAVEKRRELARVEMSKTGLHISPEMIEARELLEQMEPDSAEVTAARRYQLSMAVR